MTNSNLKSKSNVSLVIVNTQIQSESYSYW